MSEIEWVEWVEIPIRVYATFEKASGDGWNEPRTPPHVEINQIEVCFRNDDTKPAWTIQELADSIIEEDEDLFIERAYEHR